MPGINAVPISVPPQGAVVLNDALKQVRLGGLDAVDNGRGPEQRLPQGSLSGAEGTYQQAVHAGAQQHAVSVLMKRACGAPGQQQLVAKACARINGQGQRVGTRVANQIVVMGAVHQAMKAELGQLQQRADEGEAELGAQIGALQTATQDLENALLNVALKIAFCKGEVVDGFNHGNSGDKELVKAMRAADGALAGCRTALGDQAMVERMVGTVVAPHLHDSANDRLPELFASNMQAIHADEVLQEQYAQGAGMAVGALMKSQSAEQFKGAIFHLLKLPEYVLQGVLAKTDTPDGPPPPPVPQLIQVPPAPAGPAAPAGAPVAYAHSGNVTGGDNYNYVDLGPLQKLLGDRQDGLSPASLGDLLKDIYNLGHEHGRTVGQLTARIEELERGRPPIAAPRDAAPAPVTNAETVVQQAAPLETTTHVATANGATEARQRVQGPPVPPKPQRRAEQVQAQPPAAAPAAGVNRAGGPQEEWAPYVAQLDAAQPHVTVRDGQMSGLTPPAGFRQALHARGFAAGAGIAGREVVRVQAKPSDVVAYVRGQGGTALPEAIRQQVTAARSTAVGRQPTQASPSEWADTARRLQQAGEQAGSDGHSSNPLVTNVLAHRDDVMAGARVNTGAASLQRATPSPSPLEWDDAATADSMLDGTLPDLDRDLSFDGSASELSESDLAELPLLSQMDARLDLAEHHLRRMSALSQQNDLEFSDDATARWVQGQSEQTSDAVDRSAIDTAAAKQTIAALLAKRQASPAAASTVTTTAASSSARAADVRDPLVSTIPPPPPLPRADPAREAFLKSLLHDRQGDPGESV